jgi:alkyl hydroperoxide reductase subunit AhpC
LHQNLKELEELGIPMYVISKDTPEEQALLHEALTKEVGTSLPFISDPEAKLIDHLGMKNGDTSYRGYALMDESGNVVFKTVNDHYGEEIDQTIEEIIKEYGNLK